VSEVVVHSISYGILSNAEATIQSCEESVIAAYPRNSIVFRGTRFRFPFEVSAAGPRSVRFSYDREFVNPVLIPYSVHTIFSGDIFEHWEDLPFEFGSELQSIGGGTFGGSSLQYVLIPQSVNFLDEHSFARCASGNVIPPSLQPAIRIKHILRVL
jgi:hypothetical protein